MDSGDRLHDYEGETLNDMLENAGEEDAFSILGEGSLEIDDEGEKILVYKEEQESKLHYKNREGLGRLALPFEVPFRDLPFIAGKKSAKRSFDEEDDSGYRPGYLSEKSGVYTDDIVKVTVLVGMLGEVTSYGVDLPNEVYLSAPAGLAAGSFLQGRAEGFQEEDYRRQLLEEASEYEIEID